VLDALRDEGASFYDELLHSTRLLRTELEDALGELVAAGRITADSFAGLRALLVPAAKRDAHRHRRLRRHMLTGIEDAGRWSLVRPPILLPSGARREAPGMAPSVRSEEKVPDRADEGRVLAKELNRSAKSVTALQEKQLPKPSEQDPIEHIARSLLRRYGVVFWKLLEREAPWLPSWRQLLRVYHRLEARGEIRGGRFVEGLVGEQFALPEAVARLRAVRQAEPQGELVYIGGHDPLNLVGTVLAGNKLPAVIGTRVLYEDGVAVAALVASKPQWLVDASPAQQQHWRNALLGRAEHDSLKADARAAGYSL
jgi:ATP-dependent Lhr-like helicase